MRDDEWRLAAAWNRHPPESELAILPKKHKNEQAGLKVEKPKFGPARVTK